MNELQQVLTELKEIKNRLKYQSRLGLSGGRKYIAIEADKQSFWHYCDDDGTPIKENILTGYIKRIERKEGDYPKLHIFVEADQEYVLVSGFSTHFSRQAMAAIASMSNEQLRLPVIIKPDTGKDEAQTKGKKPVFCNIIQDGRTIRSGTLGTRDAEELYIKAIASLKGGNSVKPISINTSGNQKPKVATQSSPHETIDWGVFCRQYGIFPEALKDLARELDLPQGKLNPSQSETLYQAAWKKFVERSA